MHNLDLQVFGMQARNIRDILLAQLAESSDQIAHNKDLAVAAACVPHLPHLVPLCRDQLGLELQMLT